MADLKVIYIAGPGRSGSTLLGTLLGQPEGFVDVGEIWQYWRKRHRPGARANCACGEPLASCPFWAAVEAALESPGGPELASVQDAIRMSAVPRLWRQARSGQLAGSRFAVALADLYRAVAKAANARVIVDSSKIPGQGMVAAVLPGVDLYVVHLTRDPRSCVNSWRSEKLRGDGAGRVGERRPSRVLRDWNSWNLVSMTLLRRLAGKGRYLKVAYEDFADRPREQTEAILAFAGETSASLPFTGERSVILEPGHIFAGNPDRFGPSEREISRRDRWRDELPRRTRIEAQLLTTPLRQLLGYRP